MDEEDFFEAAFERQRPLQQAGLIGMSRIAVDHFYLGVHLVFFAENFDARGLFHQPPAQRVRRLPRNDEDRGARVFDVVPQVMKHAPGLGHAGGADDHHRPFLVVDGFGFINAADVSELGEIEDVVVGGFTGEIARLIVLQFGVLAKHFAHVHGQRAVHKNGKARQCAAFHHEVQAVDQLLRAANGKRRHNHFAAALHGLFDHLPQLVLRFFRRFVGAVAVRAFQDQGVHVGDGGRVAQDGHALTPEVAGEGQPRFLSFLFNIQHSDGRAQDVPGLEELRRDARRDFKRLAVVAGCE